MRTNNTAHRSRQGRNGAQRGAVSQKPTAADVEAMLAALSPDLPRDQWVQAAMALRSWDEREGWPLFDAWSRGGLKYNERDATAVWRSIDDLGGITIATLIRMARDAGWRPATVQAAEPAQRKRGRIVATYHYLDEHGAFLYRKRRIEFPDGSKITPFQRYDATEGTGPDDPACWVGGPGCMQGVRRVLYRLPWVLAAQTVYVVEGEKCADALWDFGIVATTADSGAKHWRTEYTEALAGKDIVVIPDADDAGREHAELVARALRPVARSLRLVALPDLGPKGDVADFLMAGGAV